MPTLTITPSLKIHVMADLKETDCVICMEKVTDPYTVQCGSVTPHVICNPCEFQWRLKSRSTPEGRTITCPMCRAVETDTSKRSTSSLQAELAHVYFELATKNGKSTTVNEAVRDYIHLLENVARVPHIQLAGLMRVTSENVPTVDLSRNERAQIEMEARAVSAVVSRQEQANVRAATRASQELAREQAAARRREERQARRREERERAAAQRQADAVWCESGNIALGRCPTSRKTTRYCTFRNCLKRVCSHCGRCVTH